MDEIAGRIAAAFGLSDAVADLVPAARGEQGQIWRLDTESGSYAIKESFEPQSEAEAAADVAFQEAVLAGSKISMPRPIRTTSGSVLATVADRRVRVYEWIDLLPTDYSFDVAVVGETIAAIHRVRHEPARPIHPWYTEPVGVAAWHDLSRRVTSSKAHFADAFAAHIPTLTALEALLEPRQNLQNCHRDLFADNILPMAQGGLCVIDWENCGLEDPVQELGVVVFDFTMGNPEGSRRLHDAYVDAGGPGRLSGRGDFSMLIAQFGHFFESAAKEWLNPESSEEDREHALGRFNELFATPLTLDRIDEFLDAVSG
ncbi:MAG TPA: phosphotransferase [Acidimicrobiia bacterium]|nr:phosphotransferase [Acidimicrobiia bacterium]